jgi:bisphosphoglycerate-dependent phosphoglycerate mutase
MREFGSLILLRFDDSADRSDRSDRRHYEAASVPANVDVEATALARRAANLLTAAKVSPDVAFTPPRTRSIPIVNALLGELRKLPRTVISDRRLDVQRAWHHSRGSGDQDDALQPGWLSRTETPPNATYPRSVLAADHERTRERTETPSILHAAFAASVMAEFYTERVVPLLLARQTILLIAGPEAIRGLRVTLKDGRDTPPDDDDLPVGQPLLYTFDRHLRPTNPFGSYL